MIPLLSFAYPPTEEIMSLQDLVNQLQAMNDHFEGVESRPLTIDIDNDGLGEELEISHDSSSSESEDSGDNLEDLQVNPDVWLKTQVDSDTYELLAGILRSNNSDGELQSSLTDVLGFDRLDLVIELIQRRQDFLVRRKTEEDP